MSNETALQLPTVSDTPEQFRELANVRQHANEPKRRWFVAPAMDLIVWVDEQDRPFKFQIWYETWRLEYALTWEAGRGFNHARANSGRGASGISMTPILCDHSEPFDKSGLLALFQVSYSGLPTEIGSLVLEALTLYPSSPTVAGRRPVKSPSENIQTAGVRPNWWQSMGPLSKTIVWCLAIELGIVLLLTIFTMSLLTSAMISIGFLGPVSLWIGPAILEQYRQAEVIRTR